MRTPTDTPAPSSPPLENQASPPGWVGALASLVVSRAALVRWEAKAAAGHLISRAICFVITALCLLFAWPFLLVGGIAVISKFSGWPWYWLAFGAAGLHLLAAIIFVVIATRKTKKAFLSLSRSEFQKDCQWIQSLQFHRKSKN